MQQTARKLFKRWWVWIVAMSILVIVSTNYSLRSQQAVNTLTVQPVSTSTVTGFGATRDDWNRSHISDPRFAPNAAYNPDPTLSDQAHDDRYIVTSGPGRVLSYEMRLPGTPDIKTAKSESLREFPSDASILWYSQKPTCYQMEIESRALGAALSDSQGAALVEFQTLTPDGKDVYNQADNNDIFFNLGLYPTVENGPAC
jgi:hypothetical protein